MPDSIAGLSESGANAEHTGKSCSRLELVVRECGLMLQRMVSVFLIGCLAFLRICRIRSDFPGPREIGEGNQEPVYRDSWLSYLPKLHSGRNIRDIHGRLEKNPSMEFTDFLLPIHLYCISPSFLQPLLKYLSKNGQCTLLLPFRPWQSGKIFMHHVERKNCRCGALFPPTGI